MVPGLGALGRDLPAALFGVGADHPLDVGDLGRLVEQRLHLRLDLGVGHALSGLEDDRAVDAGALAAEVLVEDVEPGAGLGVGQVELVAEGVAGGLDGAADEERRDPEPEDEPSVVVAPVAEAGEHESLLGDVEWRGPGRHSDDSVPLISRFWKGTGRRRFDGGHRPEVAR